MKNIQKINKSKKERRHRRVRAKIVGKTERHRLSVFRSAKHLYLQVIDDAKHKTVCQANSKEVKGKQSDKKGLALETGKLLADRAKKAGVSKVVFDRGSYRFHGRVKSAADGLREGGLDF